MEGNLIFNLNQKDGRARAGVFRTPHGDFETPVFAPVGTRATVRALTPSQLEELGASLILANTYHLFLRPGDEIIAELGGLHQFMGWNKPILTDSGGFQVYSLSDKREISLDGLVFRSHIDGSIHKFTPEDSIRIQENLGADIIMVLDECTHPYDRDKNETAVDRTTIWAERCLKSKTNPAQALFGIIQGGIFPDLREKSALSLVDMDFPGYAIGGLSVGESKTEMYETLDVTVPILPDEKPRYLMGVGTVEDLVEAVSRGIDLFDCVLPTRLARHGTAISMQGKMNISNSKYKSDPNPIDRDCECYTCSNFSRAYLRHLAISKEMLLATLLSIHNLYSLITLTSLLRNAILEKKFDQTKREILDRLNNSRDTDKQG